MNIPPGLKQLREAHTCDAANELLGQGWELLTVAVSFAATRERTTYFLMGWSRNDQPAGEPIAERRSGNLAHDARM